LVGEIGFPLEAGGEVERAVLLWRVVLGRHGPICKGASFIIFCIRIGAKTEHVLLASHLHLMLLPQRQAVVQHLRRIHMTGVTKRGR